MPESNLRHARIFFDKADQLNRCLIIIVLSYIDTDKTRNRTLGYIKASRTDNIFARFTATQSSSEKSLSGERGRQQLSAIFLRRQDYRKALAISWTTQLKYLTRSVPICLRYRVRRSKFRGKPAVQSADIPSKKVVGRHVSFGRRLVEVLKGKGRIPYRLGDV